MSILFDKCLKFYIFFTLKQFAKKKTELKTCPFYGTLRNVSFANTISYCNHESLTFKECMIRVLLKVTDMLLLLDTLIFPFIV